MPRFSCLWLYSLKPRIVTWLLADISGNVSTTKLVMKKKEDEMRRGLYLFMYTYIFN